MPGLQLNATRYTVPKTASTVLISVARTGLTTGTISINYTTVDGTALAGVSYISVSGTLIFAPGVMNQTFSVPIIPTTAIVGNKQFTVQLSSPSSGVQLNSSVATVTIIDSQVSTPTVQDTIPPTVQIINPMNGFTISASSIPVDFSVTENVALQNVTIKAINKCKRSYTIFQNDLRQSCMFSTWVYRKHVGHNSYLYYKYYRPHNHHQGM